MINATLESYNQFAHQYASKYSSVKSIKKNLDYFVKNAVGKTVLDLGCGHGRDSFYLSDQGLEVTGVDGSSELLKIAKSQISDCKFLLKDMRELDFAPHSFDNIWANASLLHLTKSEFVEVLKNLKKILKPGGLFYFSLQQGTGENYIDVSVVQGQRLFTRYSQNEVLEILTKLGFEVEKTELDPVNEIITWMQFFVR